MGDSSLYARLCAVRIGAGLKSSTIQEMNVPPGPQ